MNYFDKALKVFDYTDWTESVIKLRRNIGLYSAPFTPAVGSRESGIKKRAGEVLSFPRIEHLADRLPAGSVREGLRAGDSVYGAAAVMGDGAPC